jgi:formylglycine-generating enzyme required for sulfatase activity
MFPLGLAQCGTADVSGNVWDWCQTQGRGGYNNYEAKVTDDLDGEAKRVLRRGAWTRDSPAFLRCSYRSNDRPVGRSPGDGFWCVMVGVASP